MNAYALFVALEIMIVAAAVEIWVVCAIIFLRTEVSKIKIRGVLSKKGRGSKCRLQK